jgi:hypothetical protein
MMHDDVGNLQYANGVGGIGRLDAMSGMRRSPGHEPCLLTILDHSFGQDHSFGHFKFLTHLLLNHYQIQYMMSSTTF